MISKISKVILLSLILTSCNSGDSGSSQSEEGINVTFTATHQQTPSATLQVPQVPAGAKTFFNSEGVQITLTKAYLVIWRVELESDCTTTLFTQLWKSISNQLLPTVQAHTETTPTQLGTPNVINLLAEDLTELELGTIKPPPGDYCGVTVELLKADADAQRLPKDVDMIDRVLYIEGQYTSLGTGQSHHFIVDIAKIPLPRHSRLGTPLTLSSHQRTARLVTYVYYDRWFDGLDLTALDDETQQDLLLHNLVSSLSVK